jgi:hypothetical protein
MLGRGEPVEDKKSRDSIEAGIVETVDTGIPPLCPGENASVFQSLFSTCHSV